MPPSRAERLIRSVGQRIGELRVAAGLTQSDLAVALDLSLKYVQRVEGGTANLTLRSLEQFAFALGVTAADLFVEPTARPRRAGRPLRRK